MFCVIFSCIKFLIDKQQENVCSDDNLIAKTIPEIIVAYNHGSSKKDNTALNLIIRIGEIYQVRYFQISQVYENETYRVIGDTWYIHSGLT